MGQVGKNIKPYNLYVNDNKNVNNPINEYVFLLSFGLDDNGTSPTPHIICPYDFQILVCELETCIIFKKLTKYKLFFT